MYVQVLHGMKTDDPSYLLKIDAMTGKTIWRVERPTEAVSESPDSYTTPAWADVNGRAELIITGGDVISGHDPATGAEYWRADVLNPQRARNYRIVASPTVVGDLVIAPTRNNPLVAIRAGGKGNVAASHVAWTFAQGPDVPTPVSDGKLLYIVRDGGVAFALDVKTGATVYGPERLPSGNYSASPILADGKIYVTTEEEGITTVYRAGPKFEILSSNKLAGDCSPYLPEHRGGLRRPAVHADGVVPLGHRRSPHQVGFAGRLTVSSSTWSTRRCRWPSSISSRRENLPAVMRPVRRALVLGTLEGNGPHAILLGDAGHRPVAMGGLQRADQLVLLDREVQSDLHLAAGCVDRTNPVAGQFRIRGAYRLRRARRRGREQSVSLS